MSRASLASLASLSTVSTPDLVLYSFARHMERASRFPPTYCIEFRHLDKIPFEPPHLNLRAQKYPNPAR